MKMNRREALKAALFGSAAAILPHWASPARAAIPKVDCSGTLSCHNLHTDESATVHYLGRRGTFDPGALAELDHLFRCHYTDEVHPIDPGLYLLLDTIRCRLGVRNQPYRLISGYRSPTYNAKLRAKSRNVAKNSYHLKGMAADVSLDGISLHALRDVAVKLAVGGVGTYRDFIHVDVGPVRSW